MPCRYIVLWVSSGVGISSDAVIAQPHNHNPRRISLLSIRGCAVKRYNDYLTTALRTPRRRRKPLLGWGCEGTGLRSV